MVFVLWLTSTRVRLYLAMSGLGGHDGPTNLDMNLNSSTWGYKKNGPVITMYRISSNSFRGIYSFQVLPAAATKRGRLLLSSVKGKIIEWVIVVKEIPISTRNSRLHRLGTGRPG